MRAPRAVTSPKGKRAPSRGSISSTPSISTKCAWVLGPRRSASQSPAWDRIRSETGLGQFVLLGPGFERMVREQITELRRLSRDLGLVH